MAPTRYLLDFPHLTPKLDDMDASERSRLLYLTDALVAAPAKSVQLLSIAASANASAPYRHELAVLQAVAAEPQKLRTAAEALKIRLT